MNKTQKTADANKARDTNPDPITGEPGSHPVGTGIGAAGAGAAGAALGSVVGPVGTVLGAVVGAVAGGYAGKAAAEAIDPTAEDAYWRQNHASRPYSKGSDYDTYQPAYRYGWEARNRYPQDTFEAREAELQAGWSTARGQTQLEWENAKLAARDAWNRVGAKSTRSSPG